MADQNDLSEWAKIKGALASDGYDLDGQLGKGAFGTVYAVTRKDESGKEHKYAIKVMSIDGFKIAPKYPKREILGISHEDGKARSSKYYQVFQKLDCRFWQRQTTLYPNGTVLVKLRKVRL